MFGGWVHWGPEPFTDSSGCDTTTWKQAYLIKARGFTEVYVCTMYQVLQSQLQSTDRVDYKVGFGRRIEEQWLDTLKLLKP
jgi:hypothetical protein